MTTNELSLRGRRFLVTGAAGAVAGPIVRALAAAGAHVAGIDRPGSSPAVPLSFAVHADLFDLASTESTVAQVATALGGLDGVVHTVGGFTSGPLLEAPPEAYTTQFDLNVRSLFHVARACVPRMAAAGGGFFCGIASEPAWSHRSPGAALYGASKSAAAHLLRSLGDEVRDQGVRVVTVYPMGVIDTPANRRAMPDGDPAHWIDPAEIAAHVVFAASRSDRGSIHEIAIHAR